MALRRDRSQAEEKYRTRESGETGDLGDHHTEYIALNGAKARIVADSEVSSEPGHRGRAEPAGDFRLVAVCRTPSAWMISSTLLSVPVGSITLYQVEHNVVTSGEIDCNRQHHPSAVWQIQLQLEDYCVPDSMQKNRFAAVRHRRLSSLPHFAWAIFSFAARSSPPTNYPAPWSIRPASADAWVRAS